MAETCRPKRREPMTVKVKAYKRDGKPVKAHRRHTPR